MASQRSKSSPIKLSVVLATHNEEANIGKCLESVKDIAGEIIIVDGESDDKTVEIAKTFRAKIISTPNLPTHFHEMKKNYRRCNRRVDPAIGRGRNRHPGTYPGNKINPKH